MFGEIKIAPSILSADFMNMERDIHMLERGGTDFIHVDVMDGHFVPNLTLGVPFVKQLKRITTIPLDVHLMISNPLEQLDWKRVLIGFRCIWKRCMMILRFVP